MQPPPSNREPESNPEERAPEPPGDEGDPASEWGFFRRAYAACTRPDFYALPLRETWNTAGYYLVRLLLLVGLFWGSFIAYGYWNQTHRALQEIQKQMPPVTFQNGMLDVEATVPYTLRLPDGGTIILDPQGEVNRPRLLQSDPDVRAVVVNRAIYLRFGPDEFWDVPTRTHPNDEAAPAIRITGRTIDQWMGELRVMVFGFSLLMVLIGMVLQGVIRVFLFSLGGLFANMQTSADFTWTHVFNISCYAVTPVLLLELALILVGLVFPYFEYILMGGGILWVYSLTRYLDNPRGTTREFTA